MSLQRMGYSDVRPIAGRVTDWAAAGLPLRMH